MSIIPIQDTKASLRMADAKISQGPGTTANVEKCRPTLCLKNDTDQACYNSDLHQLILIVFDRFLTDFHASVFCQVVQKKKSDEAGIVTS